MPGHRKRYAAARAGFAFNPFAQCKLSPFKIANIVTAIVHISAQRGISHGTPFTTSTAQVFHSGSWRYESQ